MTVIPTRSLLQTEDASGEGPLFSRQLFRSPDTAAPSVRLVG